MTHLAFDVPLRAVPARCRPTHGRRLSAQTREQVPTPSSCRLARHSIHAEKRAEAQRGAAEGHELGESPYGQSICAPFNED
jgi:hypothetical protein